MPTRAANGEKEKVPANEATAAAQKDGTVKDLRGAGAGGVRPRAGVPEASARTAAVAAEAEALLGVDEAEDVGTGVGVEVRGVKVEVRVEAVVVDAKSPK